MPNQKDNQKNTHKPFNTPHGWTALFDVATKAMVKKQAQMILKKLGKNIESSLKRELDAVAGPTSDQNDVVLNLTAFGDEVTTELTAVCETTLAKYARTGASSPNIMVMPSPQADAAPGAAPAVAAGAQDKPAGPASVAQFVAAAPSRTTPPAFIVPAAAQDRHTAAATSGPQIVKEVPPVFIPPALAPAVAAAVENRIGSSSQTKAIAEAIPLPMPCPSGAPVRTPWRYELPRMAVQPQVKATAPLADQPSAEVVARVGSAAPGWKPKEPVPAVVEGDQEDEGSIIARPEDPHAARDGTDKEPNPPERFVIDHLPQGLRNVEPRSDARLASERTKELLRAYRPGQRELLTLALSFSPEHARKVLRDALKGRSHEYIVRVVVLREIQAGDLVDDIGCTHAPRAAG